MSTEHQQYSLANQKTTIAHYAKLHDFQIVRTYTDAGKTGVTLKRRDGLQTLLRDVVSGEAEFTAILVYDVSRWGRFQHADESAHYEFLCSSAGVPVHYCAEQFPNDGSMPSALLKALKRMMAAEYSRDLSARVQQGMVRLASLGYRMGGQPKLGFRRLLLPATGKQRLLARGEYKQLTTDRVILVPGPRREQNLVGWLFRTALRKNCKQIADELNSKGILNSGGNTWNREYVHAILTNPLYKGCNVWGRTTQSLRTPQHRASTPLVSENEAVVLRQHSIVTPELYAAVQRQLAKRNRRLTDEQVLKRLRTVLRREGSVNARNSGMAGCTVERHFGSWKNAYELLGYVPSDRVRSGFKCVEQNRALQSRLGHQITLMWPGQCSVEVNSRHQTEVVLEKRLRLCITTCRYKVSRFKTPCWQFSAIANHRFQWTLMALLNEQNNGFHSFYLFPPDSQVRYRGKISLRSVWLKSGTPLAFLADLVPNLKEVLAAGDYVRSQ